MTIKNGHALFLMILVAGILIVPAQAQTELTVYIGRDDFDSEKWVSSLDNTVVNTTREVLLLNQTGSQLSDLSEWVERGIRITISSENISFTGLDRTDDNTLAYLNKTSDSFNDFEYSFTYRATSQTSGTASTRMVVFGAADFAQDADYIDTNNHNEVAIYHEAVPNTNSLFRLSLLEITGGSLYFNASTFNLDVGTDYYVILNKNGVDWVMDVYSDPGFTALIETRELTLHGDHLLTYIIASQSFHIATSRVTSGVISDITDLGNGLVYVPTGDFYSIDLMENATQPGIARNVFGIAEIPAGTSLQVLTSDDNSSWTVNNVTEEFDIDLAPFNYTELFVRFRLNSSDGSETPLVDFYYVTYDFNCTPGNITILSGSFAEYNVSSIEVKVGDYIHGNLTSTKFVDGKTYLVDEVTGVPGWDIRFNFTGIPENSPSLAFMAFADYEGNPAHDPHIEAYNFDLGEFVNMVEYGEGAFEWHNKSLSIGGFIQTDTGNVWVRFVHHMSGSNGHFINVDYLRLRAFVPTGETVNVDAWGINWLLSIIWLVLMTIGVFKENKILIMFAGFFGIILSILMFTENMMVAVALICINLYLLYEGTA